MEDLHSLDTERGHSLVPPAEDLASVPVLYETDGVAFEEKRIWLRYFTLTGASWLIAEVDPSSWVMFGHCSLGDPSMAEWGYVSLFELASLRVFASNGLPIYVERDLSFAPCTFGEMT